tara:strand:- start:61785 stop:62015 length:231 start_codon:yes stop_codon:yes gene_type:complete
MPDETPKISIKKPQVDKRVCQECAKVGMRRMATTSHRVKGSVILECRATHRWCPEDSKGVEKFEAARDRMRKARAK